MTGTRKIILVTLAGGGFLWETQSLINSLGDQYEYHYATGGGLVWKARKMGIPAENIHSLRGGFRQPGRSPLDVRNLGMLVSFLDAYRIIRRLNPSAIVCIGSSISVPLCFWGRMFKIKTVFVESMTRVTKLSLTGKIIGTLGLCSRFYVQWPETARLQKGAIYKGTVL